MPKARSWSIATFVARCRSSTAPVEMSPMMTRSATRPPRRRHSCEKRKSFVCGSIASSCTCCVYPPARPRGMMLILMTSFCSGLPHAIMAWPHSWYAVRLRLWSDMRWRCFLPMSTSSMASLSDLRSTYLAPATAHVSAASLTIVATCAGDTPGVRSARSLAMSLFDTPSMTTGAASSAFLSAAAASSSSFFTRAAYCSSVSSSFLRSFRRAIFGRHSGSPVTTFLR
mmetsp:Transcript_27818/g.86204  ORF Transcript_27818/g.86204 Transcript_27818/m.86204 type:complete len:227 (-) Transcript_27818:1271-1951(-)